MLRSNTLSIKKEGLAKMLKARARARASYAGGVRVMQKEGLAKMLKARARARARVTGRVREVAALKVRPA